MSDKLLRLQIDYQSQRFSIVRTFVLVFAAFQVLVIFLQTYVGLDLLNLALLGISFLLFAIGLFFQMHDSLIERRMVLDEYRHALMQKKMGKVIEECNAFIGKNYKAVIYAGGVLKKKLDSGLQMTIFASHMEKNGVLNVDDWEDPVAEYKRRISELVADE